MWRHMAARAADGDIAVDRDGRVHAAGLKAIPEPASLVELRSRCQAMMPEVDIGDLILEVMGWHPEFAAAYTQAALRPIYTAPTVEAALRKLFIDPRQLRPEGTSIPDLQSGMDVFLRGEPSGELRDLPIDDPALPLLVVDGSGEEAASPDFVDADQLGAVDDQAEPGGPSPSA